MPEWTDDIQTLTNEAFMRQYRTAYWFNPMLKARLDQHAINPGRPVSGASPTSEAARLRSEAARRGLTWPDSWQAAGLDPFN